MTNQQLYFAIGIPSLIAIFNTGVVLTIMFHLFNRLDARIDRLDGRIDKLSEKMDKLTEKVSSMGKGSPQSKSELRIWSARKQPDSIAELHGYPISRS